MSGVAAFGIVFAEPSLAWITGDLMYFETVKCETFPQRWLKSAADLPCQ